MKLSRIIEELEERLPLSVQENWDHSGLNLGRPTQEIKAVLFSYDICREVIAHAKKHKCQLIVSHHPYRMGSSANVNLDAYEGKILADCVSSGIALYACHTNHDVSVDSLNYHYLQSLGLRNIAALTLSNNGRPGLGAFGVSEKGWSPRQVISHLKKIFKTRCVRFVSGKKKFYRIGICTGSGASLIDQALNADLDLFITGDVKYHQAIHAKRHGLAIADVGHFYSEIESVKILREIFIGLFGNKLKMLMYNRLKDAFVFV